jgi:sensor domain CHASE-containing protein
MHMTLRKKTLSIIGLMFMALIIVLYVASQLIVMGSFAQQEQQDTRQNVERMQSALTDNLASLEHEM